MIPIVPALVSIPSPASWWGIQYFIPSPASCSGSMPWRPTFSLSSVQNFLLWKMNPQILSFISSMHKASPCSYVLGLRLWIDMDLVTGFFPTWAQLSAFLGHLGKNNGLLGVLLWKIYSLLPNSSTSIAFFCCFRQLTFSFSSSLSNTSSTTGG